MTRPELHGEGRHMSERSERTIKRRVRANAPAERSEVDA